MTYTAGYATPSMLSSHFLPLLFPFPPTLLLLVHSCSPLASFSPVCFFLFFCIYISLEKWGEVDITSQLSYLTTWWLIDWLIDLLLAENMEFVDDFLTFQELGLHLKSHGCHVANLSSFDFSPKNGIAGCLTSLFRHFLMHTFDVTILSTPFSLQLQIYFTTTTYYLLHPYSIISSFSSFQFQFHLPFFLLFMQGVADMSVLASWYSQKGNHGFPMVVIIDDMERCCAAVLADFILMLRYSNPHPALACCFAYRISFQNPALSLQW